MIICNFWIATHARIEYFYIVKITKISSGAKWEDIVGYSRAIKIDNRIIIGGTTAINEKSEVVGKGNAYEQTKYVFGKIEKYLKKLGSSLENVIINRIYVTDISKWEEIGKATRILR
jgi:enamine deaminase RidA (YjgF/YER057c/UK114 family)